MCTAHSSNVQNVKSCSVRTAHLVDVVVADPWNLTCDRTHISFLKLWGVQALLLSPDPWQQNRDTVTMDGTEVCRWYLIWYQQQMMDVAFAFQCNIWWKFTKITPTAELMEYLLSFSEVSLSHERQWVCKKNLFLSREIKEIRGAYAYECSCWPNGCWSSE